MAKIVVIEDDYRLADVLKRYLTFNNHEAFVAYNGVDGINLVRRELPQMVIVDLFLPDFNGEQIGAILRSTPRLSGIKLILMSGAPEFASSDVPFAFDAVVIKPVNLVEFSASVNNLLSKSAVS